MKPVRLSGHALSYSLQRGFTIEQVEMAIRGARWEPAEQGRFECRKDFPFGQEWNGKVYSFKQLRPIFVVEENEIVVVTVYVYYY
jgi:hypothetical protein